MLSRQPFVKEPSTTGVSARRLSTHPRPDSDRSFWATEQSGQQAQIHGFMTQRKSKVGNKCVR
ncbi:hypothetical protein GCM10010909_12940 [Acidocella aquatica]|uniref:Uncharacterized protein n=1 Tax=Acidocella aquatica TaxID=1922313 RepID=A0ABQ6A8Z3_9PROT|nr:hypothetical protein GCM10010909_12940 [Acidocella aquatica]